MGTSWTIPGSDGEPILGDAHLPDGDAAGVVLLAHGFKGYKDYGFFPRLAAELAARGFAAHRFNFSHSGMTGDVETFARPDLFERDTWSRQVRDLRTVIDAVRDGTIPGGAPPLVLFGHSRGGAAALLAAGRGADDPAFPALAGVVTASAPATTNPLTDDQAAALLRQGRLESPSSRTGQVLHVGRAFLQEQLDDPAAHDLPALVARIRCPLLFIHGEADPTVEPTSAMTLAKAATAEHQVVLVPQADHVFNTPNPLPADAETPAALGQLMAAVRRFAKRACEAAASR